MSDTQSPGPFTLAELEVWASVERAQTVAYASYVEHCGPRAVECAEGDLLGELLAACELGLLLTFQPARTAEEYRIQLKWRRATEAAVAKAQHDNTEN